MKKKIIALTAFSIAMALLETAVVVYLRIIYFPKEHMQPPLSPSMLILATELGRELATLIMLVSAGYLCGTTRAQKFAFFVFSFATWDLFYYVFLKLLLNWPASILDWDLLFLLPVPWIGPVLAPCIVSLSLVCLTAIVLHIENEQYSVRFSRRFSIMFAIGLFIIILSFINYSFPIVLSFLKGEESNSIIRNLKKHIPASYNWVMFTCGQTLILGSFTILYLQNRKQAEAHALHEQADIYFT